jgi:competence protein ComEA
MADRNASSITRSHIAVVALITVAALLATVLVLWSAQPREQAVPLAAQAGATPATESTGSATPTPPATLPPAPTAVSANAEPRQPTEVVVHVAGKVRRPGVVRLLAGARVIDAVDAAGGARNGADLSSVNLARELTDGEQVRVGLPADPAIAGIEPPTGPAAAGPLDLNSASASDLESLPGVGPVLAERIVAYREESGPFRTVDQLVEVAGIGPAVLDDVTDLVRV